MEHTHTMLRYGSTVRLANPDMYGYWGRDLHPTESDVGFLGTVCGNVVCFYDEDGAADTCKENVLGGTEVSWDDEGLGAEVCYIVQDASGRKLELMLHEIEVVCECKLEAA